MNEVVVARRAANKDTCSSCVEPGIFFKWRLKEPTLSNIKYLLKCLYIHFTPVNDSHKTKFNHEI